MGEESAKKTVENVFHHLKQLNNTMSQGHYRIQRVMIANTHFPPSSIASHLLFCKKSTAKHMQDIC